MAEPLPELDLDLSTLSEAEWHSRVEDLGEELGYYLTVGGRHTALFIDAGPKLLVTFEEVSNIRRLPDARPRGFELAERNGWSLLTILADGPTWFRDPAVYAFFDRQVDDGFFEDFDDVLFYGQQMGGYAAGAYSVTAPGARVLLISPVATLQPELAGWDRRHRRARRLDFVSRYGFAPDMVDAADRAWVIRDPGYGPDAMHAALYRRPNVTLLSAPHTRFKLPAYLDHTGLAVPLIEAAMQGTLDREAFGRIWRYRRRSAAYVRGLLARTEAEGRPGLSERVCRYGLGTADAAYYEDRIRRLARDIRGEATVGG